MFRRTSYGNKVNNVVKFIAAIYLKYFQGGYTYLF